MAAGAAVDERLVRAGKWWLEFGHFKAAGLLGRPDAPTALLCVTDWMAMGA